jgi:hypothetical protein
MAVLEMPEVETEIHGAEAVRVSKGREEVLSAKEASGASSIS